MSKAIRMNSGSVSFLVETDNTVELPPGMQRPTVAASGLPQGMSPVGSMDQLERQFADVQALILTCCNSLYDSLSQLPHPERVAVEFGVKLAGEAGVPMLTKASGEANFKVSVEWKPTKA